jgi:hypothetical protein
MLPIALNKNDDERFVGSVRSIVSATIQDLRPADVFLMDPSCCLDPELFSLGHKPK